MKAELRYRNLSKSHFDKVPEFQVDATLSLLTGASVSHISSCSAKILESSLLMLAISLLVLFKYFSLLER